MGVPEYWIVDPENESVKVFRHTSRGFALAPAADELTTPLIPGFSVAVRDIFEP
jgi:Uma2 family endonuclease